MKSFLLKSYFFLFVVFAIFSFVLTDPNLTLLNLNFFVSLQTYLWQHVLPLQNFRTIFYGVLITLIFINYLLILKNWHGLKLDVRQNFWKFLIIVSLPLIFSYNALSHDLFNYIFNAKMIIEYGANPHVQTAINFPNDPMLRFMNNIHTPAPYGYGWTTLSLLPYLAGLGKFLSTFIVFKLFAFLSLILALLISEKFFKKANYFKLALFFLNPLLLIEILSSAHNDLWMLAPALLAVYLATNLQKKKIFKIILIAVLLTVSISIKFATIVLLPLIIYLALKNRLGRLGKFPTYDLMALAMFAPLLTERSKQFLPWYLLWSLIFLPLIKNKFLRNLLIVFSFSSLLRYLPWMYYLPWMSFHLDSSSLESLQKAITWLIPSFYLLLSATFFLFNRRSEK
ncbi:MAG: hypothetical protein UT13_C0001G0459 [Candidatus Pacebacteria bacterium GW2011_GWF2_38_9]|nr:MAG: hypothetical protein US01_C0001G0472 [candidate division TM6 bacterium GW2011_GWF2_28_16]KKQ10228.1 MAG: hypothetical protein US20_C0002G0029 [Candidatus Pacebacteria bacterium GW2011_GWF1_36_5]KKQ88812.1 MAG: hypothetical protein UT13_C0001G0459 [Candidatus Pacebacteria bacterium GW2011_GWF2_38_9]HAZ73248.1 hypothetical protein [Candidatus Paceibacterota bacterium]